MSTTTTMDFENMTHFENVSLTMTELGEVTDIPTGSVKSFIYKNENVLFDVIVKPIVFLCIITCNSLTLISTVKFKILRTTHHMLIFNLSLGDILLSPTLFYVFYREIPNPFMAKLCCGLSWGLLVMSVAVSMLTVLMMAIDRYWAVVRPCSYKTVFTKSRVKKYIIFTWLYGFCYQPLVLYYTMSADMSVIRRPFALRTAIPAIVYKTLIMAPMIVTIAAACSLYIHIFYVINKKNMINDQSSEFQNQAHIWKQLQDKKITKMMAFILFALICAYIPYLSFPRIFRNGNTVTVEFYLIKLSIMFLYSNAFWNVFIYAWHSKDYKRAYMTLLGCYRESWVDSVV